MSDDIFYGRVINSGLNSFKIDVCEVCLQKSPIWVEIKGSAEENFALRLTCDDCHVYFTDQIPEESNFSRQIKENENIDESVRPGWVDEFISNSQSIESIEENEDEKKSNNTSWSKEFIDEALFGSDPVGFLKNNGLFTKENSTKTIEVLSGMVSSELSNVKLSVIQCLFEFYLTYKELKKIIEQSLNNFRNDSNEMVSQFATEIIEKLK